MNIFNSTHKILSGHVLIALFLVNCVYNENKVEKNNQVKTKNSTNGDTLIINPSEHEIKLDTLEQKLVKLGLIDVQKLDSTLLVDLKYSSTDNFMKKDMYGDLNRAYLQEEVAYSLVKSQKFLQSIDSSLTLLIYDAVRPRSVQQYMWDILDMPISEKTKFVSNPKNGSIHNYGSAIDLTIAKQNGLALDMGAKYDEIGKIAYPKFESKFLKSGDLTQIQIDNRKLLRKVMAKGNFTNISTEWWHFNRYPRWKAKELYQIVE